MNSDSVLSIVHADFYIKSGNGTSIIRNIFNNVEYDDYEKQQIQFLKNFIKEKNLLIDFKDSQLLKMLVVAQYDIEKASVNCVEHRIFLHKCRKTDLSKSLEKGTIYTRGVDKQMRPVVIINNFISIEVISHFLQYVKENLLVDYYVENWTVIVDLDKELPVMQMDDLLFLQLHFCGNLNKVLIVNGPYDLDNILSQFTDKFKYLKSKIKIIEDYTDLQLYIAKEQLEEKYGGDLPNTEHFWPLPKREQISNPRGSHLSVLSIDSPRKGSFMKITVQEENGNTIVDQQVSLDDIKKENQTVQSSTNKAAHQEVLSDSDSSESESEIGAQQISKDLKEEIMLKQTLTKYKTETGKAGQSRNIITDDDSHIQSSGICGCRERTCAIQ